MATLSDSTYLSKRSIISFFTFFLTISMTFGQLQTPSVKIPEQSDKVIVGIDSIDVGYRTQKKSDITSAITGIKCEVFNKGFIENPLQLIQGRIAGLSVSKAGSDPNRGFEMRIRGMNTLYGITTPLVVIDGMIDGSLDNLDPNDIESISILKDGSAAIYGLRGSGGVILMTTKNGKNGKAIIEYNVSGTAETVAKNEPAMNAKEWRLLSKETGLGTDFGTSTNWFKQIEQRALSQVHNISLSGGTDKTSYRASVNYRTGNGVLINTGYDQLNSRIKITQKALNDKFTMDLNMGATERESQLGFPEAFKYAAIYNPTAPVKSSDPAYSIYDGYFQQALFDYYNPVSIIELNKNEMKSRIMNLSIKGTYEILKGLSIDGFYSTENSSMLGGQYFDSRDLWGGINRNGLASRYEDNYASHLLESSAHYNGDLNSAININALVGYSRQDFTNEGFSAQGGNFLTNDFTFNNLSAALDFKNGKGSISSYKYSNKLTGFVGHLNVNILSMYFISASARYEGSSRFGSANKWGLFPAISGGVDISKLINVSIIDNLKIRANYGITGNQPGDSYLSILRLRPSGNFFYNGAFIPSYSQTSNTNPDLKWERTGQFDAGFDFSLLSNKVYGSFDYYTNTTKDLLVQIQVPVPPNIYGYTLMNLGRLRNSGLELTINLNLLKKSDFSYIVSITPFYSLEDKLGSLSGTYNGQVIRYGVQDLGIMGVPGQSQVPLVRLESGKPVGQFVSLVLKGIDTNGNRILVDENNNGTIDQSDKQIVGNGLPKFIFGFGNDLTYKKWELNILFRGVLGQSIINTYAALYEVPYMISSYNLPNTASGMRNPSTLQLLNAASGVFSNNDVENASFICLDNICLGYTFTLKENSSFSKIKLYCAGNNLLYITGYKGADPNTRYTDIATDLGTFNSPLVPGVDRMTTWPRARSVTFGANVVF
jgi:TonB-dependent starch-binding outer membrane protein SusC